MCNAIGIPTPSRGKASIPPRPSQREVFERDDMPVSPDHVVVRDPNLGKPAASRPRVDGESGKTVRVASIADRRPGRKLFGPPVRFV